MNTNNPALPHVRAGVETKTIRVSSNWRARALSFLMVAGPGLIVMEADNDAGAVSTYVQAGAQYGTHLLWLLLVLLPICYFVQEMVVRLGIATGQGHAAMIYRRFGKWWGHFSLADLLLLNFLTLVTEFAAIALALGKLGVDPLFGVPVAAVALTCLVLTGSYRRWERIVVFLCLLDLAWFVIALRVHPAAEDVFRHTVLPSLPASGLTGGWLFLV
ncbi:MAG: Nramp family divalent metal transporter, partial [Terriglobia bacterium]